MKIYLLNLLLSFPYFSLMFPIFSFKNTPVKNINSNPCIKYTLKNKYCNKKYEDKIVLYNNNLEQETLFQLVEKKRIGFLKLIRFKNIIPTFLLCFSGGWVMSPSWFHLWTNIHFIVTTISSIFIMSSSMIINDLFDLNIDAFNMLKRPLVTGEVSKWEAILYIFFLLNTTEFLSLYFLPPYLQDNIHFSIISLLLYTPIFKKITFVKNIFCAFFVAFAVFLGGNASSHEILSLQPNFNLFSILLSITFFGSLFNEIILDIRDYDGDKFYNVKTIPVLIGNDLTWIMTGIILFFSILFNTFSLMYIKGVDTGCLLPFMYVPVLKQFFIIKQKSYSRQSIVDLINASCGNTFIIILLFFYLHACIV